MSAALWILGWLRKVPWQAWACVALALLVLAYGHWRYNAGQADTQARWDAQEAAYAVQRAKAAEAARKTEERHRADLAAAVERLNKGHADAQAETDRLIADLRAGNLRLRDRFKAPACGVPGAPADPGAAPGAGAAYVRVEDQEFLLRVGADADRVVRKLTACQAALGVGR